MKHLSLWLFLALFLSNFSAMASTITCTHPSVCLLAKEVLTNAEQLKFEIVIESFGDAHDFNPTQKQVKKMMKAEYLLVPPLELVPWANSIVHKRIKDQTIVLNSKNLPLTGSPEALAHFWLHPQLICFHKIAIATQMKERWKLEVKKPDCVLEEKIQSKFDQLKQSTSQGKYVLTHDALAPLFERTFKNIVTLKGSHHGESIQPQSIKKLHQFIDEAKNSPITWIIENQISVPARIAQKIRPHDKRIDINTSADGLSSMTQVLENLLQELGSSL